MRLLPKVIAQLLLLTATAATIAKPSSVSVAAIGVEPDGVSYVTNEGRFAADGTVIAIYQPNFRSARRASNSAAAEAIAREYLAAKQQTLGFASELNIEKTFARVDAQLSVVRFRQLHQGLPVYQSDTAVTLSADGKVIFLANGLQAKLRQIDTQATVDAGTALQQSKAWSGTQDATYVKQELVIFQTKSATKLAWQTSYVDNNGAPRDLETLVDAKTGELLRAQDKTLNVDGSGMAFVPDPLSSAQAAYGSGGFTDGNDADTPDLVGQIRGVPLLDIRSVAGGFDLVGPYAACSSHSAPNVTGECTVSSSTDFFVASRSDDRFEVSNVYYHIDTYMRYMNQTLGISVTPSQYAGGVKFDPHGLNGADNSSFTGGNGFLQFGDGGVDDAEDADVIVHELGHGIHFWLTNGGLSNANGDGLSEGTGDYAAMSYSRSFDQWPTTAPEYNWMFSWDGHNPFWQGRITNYQLSATWPNLPTTSPHTPGQYWASCNMLNYRSIGRLKSDRAFWRGIAATNASSRQNDAAQAVLNAAAAMNYSSADLLAMHSNFVGGQPAGKCTYTVTLPSNPEFVFANGFED